jgi:hypothetical protein
MADAGAYGAAHQQPQADTLLKKLIDEVFAARGEPVTPGK